MEIKAKAINYSGFKGFKGFSVPQPIKATEGYHEGCHVHLLCKQSRLRMCVQPSSLPVVMQTSYHLRSRQVSIKLDSILDLFICTNKSKLESNL